MSRPADITNPRPSSATAIIAAVMVCLASAQACTIPVFRYALDRWPADHYRLAVPASVVSQPEMVKLLVPYRGNSSANLQIETEGTSDKARLMSSFASETPLWSGTLDKASLDALMESPARKDLIKRILGGESVVWFIVMGDKLEDITAAERIEKRLKFLEQVVQLPPQDPNDPDSQLGPGPALRLKLSSVRIKMSDPAEKLFCRMLAGNRCADKLAKGEAFAAPVFGRGRVLGAWPVTELDEAAIEDATMFLTGRCSCRVKNQSPGWDVLLNVDWETALPRAARTSAAVAPSGSAPEVVTTKSQPEEDEEFVVSDTTITVEGFPWKRTAIIGGAAIGALAVSMLWIRR